MALNWQHIKGANGNTPVYTYLEFGETNGEQPELFTLTINQAAKPSTGSLGYIVTTAGTKPFTADVGFNSGKKIYLNADGDKNAAIYHEKNESTNTIVLNSDLVKTSQNLTVSKKLTSNTLEVTSTSTFKDNVSVDSGKTLTVGTATVVSAEKIDAPYFNATSDIRAKTNIHAFNQSALDIINHLQTYTYTYKDNNIPSYGLMAQDLAQFAINDFSFVENAAATGINGDYMSIHETKLIYLLIEGMKEQQKQIEDLKLQLAQLTK